MGSWKSRIQRILPSHEIHLSCTHYIKQRNAGGVPIRARRRSACAKPLLLLNIILKVLDGADGNEAPKRSSIVISDSTPVYCILETQRGSTKIILELIVQSSSLIKDNYIKINSLPVYQQ